MSYELRITNYELVPCSDEGGAQGQDDERVNVKSSLELKAADSASSKAVWNLLIPDGLVDSINGDFTLDKEGAAKVKEIFEQRGVDLVIDYDHSSMPAQVPTPGPPRPAAGWIKDLMYVADQGLFGLVDWTPQARNMIRSREYRYLSPSVWLEKKTRRVLALDSAGLTHKPAIKGGLPVAASRVIPFKEKTTMSDVPEETAGAGDPGMLVAEIKALLGIEVENDTDILAVLRAIRDWAKSKGKGEGEGEGEGGGETVASSARQALGLSADAGADAVTVAINTLKDGTTSVKELQTQLSAIKEKQAAQEAETLLAPYERKGVIQRCNKDGTASKDWEIFSNMAKSQPDNCKHILDGRVAMLPMSGQTTAPTETASTANSQDDELITNAVKEHDGSFKDGIIALQTRLIDEECERTGFAKKRAIAVLEKQHPKIFAG